MPAHRRAFTLIEVMIAIALMAALIGAVLLSTGTTRDNQQFDAGARELFAAVQYARAVARSQGTATFRLYHATDDRWSWSVENAAGRTVLCGLMTTCTAVSCSPSSLLPIVFQPNGTVPQDGTVRFVCGTGRQASLTLTRATGAISLSFP